MKMFLIALAISLILSLGAYYLSREEPYRNGYQPRRRTRIKGARTIISEPQHPIVGDGAWQTKQAEYPEGEINGVLPSRRSARISDMQEPMGY